MIRKIARKSENTINTLLSVLLTFFAPIHVQEVLGTTGFLAARILYSRYLYEKGALTNFVKIFAPGKGP
jgi:hypothetical protein